MKYTKKTKEQEHQQNYNQQVSQNNSTQEIKQQQHIQQNNYPQIKNQIKAVTLKRNFEKPVNNYTDDYNVLDEETILQSQISDEDLINDDITETYLREQQGYSSEADSFSDIGNFKKYNLDNYQELKEEQALNEGDNAQTSVKEMMQQRFINKYKPFVQSINVVLKETYADTDKKSILESLCKLQLDQSLIKEYCAIEYKIFTFLTQGNFTTRVWYIHQFDQKMGPYISMDMDILHSRGLLQSDCLVSVSQQEPLPLDNFLMRTKTAIDQMQIYIKLFYSKLYEEDRIKKYQDWLKQKKERIQGEFMDQQFPELSSPIEKEETIYWNFTKKPKKEA